MYASLKRSGLLEQFIEDGKEFIFISNIDNLGATVDLNILNFLLNPPQGSKPAEFVMEVTDKTRSDVKGGTLIMFEDRLQLLEIAQVQYVVCIHYVKCTAGSCMVWAEHSQNPEMYHFM